MISPRQRTALGDSDISAETSARDRSLADSPALDIDAAASAFGRHGRVRLADVLDPVSADRLYACLAGQVPWRLTYNEGEKDFVVDETEFWKLDGPARSAFMQQIVARAKDHFQYVYQMFPMISAYLRGEQPELYLHRVLEWLNEPETLQVFRRITGIGSLCKANAQATLYRPGNFLKLHDDSNRPSERRRVAYVLSMTREWRADWGGQLQFLTTEGEVAEAWLPGYNTLALFAVPTPHAVSYVAPFAQQPRYSITGWLCDG